MHKKQNLPTKICTVCGLPFTWRKKWEKVWEDVKYCSERCRSNRNRNKPIQTDYIIVVKSKYLGTLEPKGETKEVNSCSFVNNKG